jgi:tetratricopeptide (TPR) repeat protein
MATPKRPPLVLLVIAGVLVIGIGAALWRYSRFNSVHAVNGLEVAVDVTLDGVTRQVLATGRVEFRDVPAGTHMVTVKLKDVELERTLVFVKGGGHDQVYNVGGAAPLVWERIAYSTYRSNQVPQFTVYCGHRFVEVESVDYAFVEPPKTISTKGGGTLYKTHLTVEQGGLKACQSWALDQGTQEMWADWQRLEARIDPKKTLYAVEEYARQGDLREAQVLLEQVLKVEPTVTLHSIYESVLLASDQLEKAKAKYARSAHDPGASDVDLFYAARLLPMDERLAFLDQALLRFPQSGYLLYARALTLDRKGDSARALESYELAEANPPPALELNVTEGHLSALLRLKRYAQAWAIAEVAYRDTTSIEGAVSYANIAAVTGRSADWSSKLKPHQLQWASALLGDTGGLGLSDLGKKADKATEPESFRTARDVIQLTFEASGKTPAPLGALSQVVRASDSVLRLLPDTIVWLLLTEAWRVGDTAAAARLVKHAAGYDAPRVDEALRFIATGELTLQLEKSSDAMLAVLWLARGRRLATLGDDPTRAFAEVLRLDAFRSVVSRAFASWPEARAGTKLPWLPVD